ncbi:TonB-dependent receptor [Novosphingobium sp. BL-8A]|uniref:TonB-dependent receptor n=1 Tax=Novosphingobium sp. BL-8A TaxID=3127639 RepID=UPI003757727D
MMKMKTCLLAGVPALLVGATPALAQNATPEAGEVAADIVVTAQRRPENIRDVPIAVSVLSGDKISAVSEGGADILSLAGRTPSLYVESSNGRYAPRLYIRGLGNVDFDFNASQPVSVVLDDVVLENVYLKGFPLFDLDSVEVLKGPQGTLFGRNTTAGVVKMDTRRPGDHQEGQAQFTVGELGTIRAEVGATIPVSSTLSLRVAGLANHREDWVNNAYDASFTKQGKDLGGFDDVAGRIHALWKPDDRLSVLLTLQARSYRGTGTLNRANVLTTGSNKLNDRYDRDTVYYDGGRNNPQAQDTTSEALHVDYDFGGATLTAIVSAYQGSSSGRGDIDGGVLGTTAGSGTIPFNSETGTLSSDLDQQTYEVRLASNGETRFGWQVGAFYWHENFELISASWNGTGGLDPTVISQLNQKSDSWSVFGQVHYDVTDRLRLTGGARWTRDQRDLEAARTLGAPFADSRHVGDKQPSWDVSALYRFSPQVSLFGRIAHGYRGPSIQGRIATSNILTTADSETITSYEAGIKAATPDNRFRVDLTGYIYDLKDPQFTAIGGQGNFNQLINAKRGKGRGVEFEATAIPVRGLQFNGGISYNFTKIDDPDLLVAFCGAACTVRDPIVNVGTTRRASIDGNPFPQAPRWLFNFNASYTYELASGSKLYAQTDWVAQKDFNLFLYDATEFHVGTNFEGGARIGWRSPSDAVDVFVFGRNITNESNVIGAIDFNNLTAFVNDPRVLGAGVSFRF